MSKDTPNKIIATTFWRTADGWETYNEGYRAGLRKAIELIGQDEQSDFDNYWDTVNAGRNKLRKALRQALEAELEKGNG